MKLIGKQYVVAYFECADEHDASSLLGWLHGTQSARLRYLRTQRSFDYEHNRGVVDRVLTDYGWRRIHETGPFGSSLVARKIGQ